MTHDNLLSGPPPTMLAADLPDADTALASGEDAATVAARWPTHLASWAALAEVALAEGRAVDAYAYARVGYHRGLDALRRNGWKGHGPVPWSHQPNRGFLQSLRALGAAAAAIGEADEAPRCATFLYDCDPTAPPA